jgi:hypothetical protein
VEGTGRACGGRVDAQNLDHVAVDVEDQTVRLVNQVVQHNFEMVLLGYARASVREVS